jgi:hypothetical protein
VLKGASPSAEVPDVESAQEPVRSPLGSGRPAAGGVLRLRAVLAEDGLLIGTAALFVALWAFAGPYLVTPDSWLNLVGGREIVEHGIPRGDELAILSQGQPWIDQQWLAQVAYWSTYSVAGIRGPVLTTILLSLAALALAFVLARRRGASATSIVPFALVSFLYVSSVVRAQAFSLVLFVVLLGLLVAESRRPSRRVWLAFPLLVLWANVHGAVFVGVALTSLLGACELAGRLRSRSTLLSGWLRPAVLCVAPWLCLLATPWGLAMVGYYRSTMANPVFRQASTEWMPPVLPSVIGFAVFPLAAAAIALVTRRRGDLTSFELWALALTLVGALLAVRSAPWFAYSCLLLLPPLLERSRGPREAAPPTRLRVGFATAMVTFAVVGLTSLVVAPAGRVTGHWPSAAAATVTRAVRGDADARVLASHQHADWLLFADPALRGRVAFDGRWEVLSPEQMRTVVRYQWQVGDDWERFSDGYRVIVLHPQEQKRLVETYDGRSNFRVLYRDRNVVVYDRGAQSVR